MTGTQAGVAYKLTVSGTADNFCHSLDLTPPLRVEGSNLDFFGSKSLCRTDPRSPQASDPVVETYFAQSPPGLNYHVLVGRLDRTMGLPKAIIGGHAVSVPLSADGDFLFLFPSGEKLTRLWTPDRSHSWYDCKADVLPPTSDALNCESFRAPSHR